MTVLAVKFSEYKFNFRMSKITLKFSSTAALLSSSTAELKEEIFLSYLTLWQRLSLRGNFRDNPPFRMGGQRLTPRPLGKVVGAEEAPPCCRSSPRSQTLRGPGQAQRNWPSGLQPQNDLTALPTVHLNA